MKLHEMRNTTIKRKRRKLLGRGLGSGRGKTCTRGEKGAGSRAGWTSRPGYEGGQFRQFMKVPIRGFSNALFRKTYEVINLSDIERCYNEGEVVNEQSMRDKGLINGPIYGIKILGNGSLRKKVTLEADKYSVTAKDKLTQEKISFTEKE